MSLVGLVKQGLLGGGTKPELLETNNGLNGTKGRRSTLALGYLMGDREESVGFKESLMLQLVEPPKISWLVQSQAILREDERHSRVRRVVELVELSKILMIVGSKRFSRGAFRGMKSGVQIEKLGVYSNGCWKQVKVGVKVKI
ncbi:hypothetical protein L195_g045121 [Trifolium pratense]|uniref:Uncharacterized protein n=1 Tax=Trifolium pratense TaxID=57577 RepID=A0A2K3MDY5_TRIPR|nr:hypothetical protein L195_g045121 [Trifolium pratense]